MKAIKRRRLTVKNIQQITKAMNLVATSKLQRARSNLAELAIPTLAAFDITYNTINSEEAREQQFVLPRTGARHVAYVLITSNRGLCGSYNSAVCKELVRHTKLIAEKHKASQEHLPFEKRTPAPTPLIIPVGTKGRDYFKRRNYELVDIDAPSEPPSHKEASAVYERLMSLYQAGKIDDVYVVYTKFTTILNQEPIVRPLLPLSADSLRRILGNALLPGEDWEDLGFFKRQDAKPNTGIQLEVEYEPDLVTVLESVVPVYLAAYLRAAMASSALCEQASRMTSMDSATNNAGDIIEKLTLLFNRQRQSIITQEITEIVSGANALQ
jgi:F-type H+-transporting ATPase subunit gamma